MTQRPLSVTNTTTVTCLSGELDGAPYEYQIRVSDAVDGPGPGRILANIFFQHGSIHTDGVNGCTNEDLLRIVVDRLRAFQKGDFSSRENALALTKVEEALHWLRERTSRRRAASEQF